MRVRLYSFKGDILFDMVVTDPVVYLTTPIHLVNDEQIEPQVAVALDPRKGNIEVTLEDGYGQGKYDSLSVSADLNTFMVHDDKSE